MDKIKKLLRKISHKERVEILSVIDVIISGGSLKNYDLLKLQGFDDLYRIRIGQFRVIYKTEDDVKRTIISLERRNDNTYKDL